MRKVKKWKWLQSKVENVPEIIHAADWWQIGDGIWQECAFEITSQFFCDESQAQHETAHANNNNNNNEKSATV